jgi:hypothetical protein
VIRNLLCLLTETIKLKKLKKIQKFIKLFKGCKEPTLELYWPGQSMMPLRPAPTSPCSGWCLLVFYKESLMQMLTDSIAVIFHFLWKKWVKKYRPTCGLLCLLCEKQQQQQQQQQLLLQTNPCLSLLCWYQIRSDQIKLVLSDAYHWQHVCW